LKPRGNPGSDSGNLLIQQVANALEMNETIKTKFTNRKTKKQNENANQNNRALPDSSSDSIHGSCLQLQPAKRFGFEELR
jgi:hypothetical protein